MNTAIKNLGPGEVFLVPESGPTVTVRDWFACHAPEVPGFVSNLLKLEFAGKNPHPKQPKNDEPEELHEVYAVAREQWLMQRCVYVRTQWAMIYADAMLEARSKVDGN